MKYGKLTLGQIEAVVNKLGGEEGVAKFLRDEPEVVARASRFIETTFKQLVDYDLSIKKLVEGYDRTDYNITDDNFPSTEKGKKRVEFALFNFVKYMTSDKVISEMEKSGYRPATIKELFSFGNKNGWKSQIIALGSATESFNRQSCVYLHVVYPAEDQTEYCADIDSCGFEGWDYRYRFLAVRK